MQPLKFRPSVDLSRKYYFYRKNMKLIIHTILIFITASVFISFSETASCTSKTDSTFYFLYKDYLKTDKEKAYGYAEMFIDSNNDELAENDSTAALMTSIGTYLEDESFKFSKAVKYYESAKDIYSKTGNRHELGRTYWKLANINYRLKQYDMTLENISMSMSLAENGKDTLTLLRNRNLLGIVHLICRESDTAEQYIDSYLKGAREYGDSSLISFAYNNKAAISAIRNDSSATIPLLDEAMSYCPKGNNRQLFKLKMNLASFYLAEKRFKDFLKTIEELIPIAGNAEELARIHHNLGWYHIHSGDKQEAVSELEKALEQYKKGEFYDEQKDILHTLGNLYHDLGEILPSNRCYREYMTIESRITGKDETMIKLFKYRNTIEKNSAEYALQSIRNRHRNSLILYIAILIVISSASVASYIIFSYRKKKELLNIENQKKLNERIEKEMKEAMELKKMYEFQNNRLINAIYSDLKELQNRIADTETKNEINGICRKLFNVNHESSQAFAVDSKYIPEFNSDLISRLSADFPNLSINDKRLCAFLNLNLSTKEISEITKQSPQSINIARARLRKKIGLSGSDITIHEFLLKYSE